MPLHAKIGFWKKRKILTDSSKMEEREMETKGKSPSVPLEGSRWTDHGNA
jgi:hypothetical protein